MTQNVNHSNPPYATGAYIKIGDNEGITATGEVGQLDATKTAIINSYAQVLFSEKKDGWLPGTFSQQTAIARKNGSKTVVDIYNDGTNPFSGALLSRTITYDEFKEEMAKQGKSFQESTI
jgi:hypothetical protein